MPRAPKPALTAAAALLLAAAWARAQARQNLIEFMTASLQGDPGFAAEERGRVLAAVRDRFADYSLQVLDPQRRAGGQVAMRMIIEGQFDGAAPERQAEVAFAAYQAVARGAPAEVVEGIALYGYRKRIPAERISLWANGYNDLVANRVPADVAADLVRNAMENDWEDSTFNTLKWGLVDGAKERFDPKDHAVYLFGHMLKGKSRPGALTADAAAYFRKLKGRKPDLPPYEGVFTSGRTPRNIIYEALPKPEVPEPAPPAPAPPAPSKPKRPASPPRTAEPAPPAPAHGRRELPELRLPRTVRPDEPQGRPKPAPTPRELGLAMQRLWPGLDQSARSYLGTPYVWGGTTRKGVDCSALTQNSYGENKVGIPRVSRQQWKIGDSIRFPELVEGDLVFFNTMGVGVSHVGMVVERGGKPHFIHASSSRGVVIDDITKNYYKSRYLGARRVVP